MDLLALDESHVIVDLPMTIGCTVLHCPIIYLELPLDGNTRPSSFRDPIFGKTSKCLEYWKGVLFSLGSQVIILGACLSSIPPYLFVLV